MTKTVMPREGIASRPMLCCPSSDCHCMGTRPDWTVVPSAVFTVTSAPMPNEDWWNQTPS